MMTLVSNTARNEGGVWGSDATGTSTLGMLPGPRQQHL